MNPIIAQRDGSYALSIEFPSGMVPPAVLEILNRVVAEETARLHVTTAQKLMLLDLTEAAAGRAVERLSKTGIRFKRPKEVYQPRVCVGSRYCRIGVTDALSLGERIYERYGGGELPCNKLKSAVSGCKASCAHSTIADIGFVGRRAGYDVFMGGKSGYRPIQGRLVASGVDEDEALRLMGRAIEIYREYHDPDDLNKTLVRLLDVMDGMGLDRFKALLS